MIIACRGLKVKVIGQVQGHGSGKCGRSYRDRAVFSSSVRNLQSRGNSSSLPLFSLHSCRSQSALKAYTFTQNKYVITCIDLHFASPRTSASVNTMLKPNCEHIRYISDILKKS